MRYRFTKIIVANGKALNGAFLCNLFIIDFILIAISTHVLVNPTIQRIFGICRHPKKNLE